MDILETFAANLKYAMRDKSVSEVAREIGIPQQTLHRYLHAQRQIGIINLVKIAKYFNESVDYLVGLLSH